MQKIILIIIGVLLIATAEARQRPQTKVSSRSTEQNGKGPHLKMDISSHDFGDIPRKGGDLIKSFSFVNDGTTPLVITRIITSCSCLKAEFPKKPIAAGDSASIRIVYEPHKREAGTFNKVIQVYSNSIDGRHIITLKGNSIDKK